MDDPTAVQPLLTGLEEGEYTYCLTVTDDQGQTDTDCVNINVAQRK